MHLQQQTTLERDADKVLRQLHLIVKRLRHAEQPGELEIALKAAGLADRHLSALVSLSTSGPVTVSEFARERGTARASASLLVSELGRKGFITRHEDERDLRRRIIAIAPKHQASVNAFRRSRAATVEHALEHTSDRERATLIKLLALIAEPPPTEPRGQRSATTT